jgi:hypothetical protein
VASNKIKDLGLRLGPSVVPGVTTGVTVRRPWTRASGLPANSPTRNATSVSSLWRKR